MHYEFDWSVLFDYRDLLLQGLQNTLEVASLSLLLSFVIGAVVGTARQFAPAWVRLPCAAYVEFFRNVPAIVQLFFWYFAVGLDIFPAAVIGLSVFSSTYFSEVIRSGYRTTSKTQIDAARASGLSFLQMVRYVVLPQSLIRVLPALSLECISVIKNSSLAMTIGVAELTFQSQEINALTFRGFEAATAVTLIYVAIVFLFIGLTHLCERLLKPELRS